MMVPAAGVLGGCEVHSYENADVLRAHNQEIALCSCPSSEGC
jgi:hypothetical protein